MPVCAPSAACLGERPERKSGEHRATLAGPEVPGAGKPSSSPGTLILAAEQQHVQKQTSTLDAPAGVCRLSLYTLFQTLLTG